MRRTLSVCVLTLVGSAVWLIAQNQVNTYEQISVGTSPATIAATTLEPAGQGGVFGCSVRVESASVRYRLDGSQATATSGYPLMVGIDDLQLTPGQARNASFHAPYSTTALVNVRCWR